MLDQDELHALIASISTHGQQQPIVLDRDGRILDRRGRLLACETLGVEPQVSTFQGDDPSGYAATMNLDRRA